MIFILGTWAPRNLAAYLPATNYPKIAQEHFIPPPLTPQGHKVPNDQILKCAICEEWVSQKEESEPCYCNGRKPVTLTFASVLFSTDLKVLISGEPIMSLRRLLQHSTSHCH